jgi:hypothetical protein
VPTLKINRQSIVLALVDVVVGARGEAKRDPEEGAGSRLGGRLDGAAVRGSPRPRSKDRARRRRSRASATRQPGGTARRRASDPPAEVRAPHPPLRGLPTRLSGRDESGPERLPACASGRSKGAAALGKLPGATVERLEADADGNAAYEAHLTKADGSRTTVYVDGSFNVVGVETGH